MAALSYALAASSAVLNVPNQTRLAFLGSRISAAHFRHGLCLTPLFLLVTENGKQERHLVATVGKFSVIWDFQQVKNSGHECYNQQGLKSCYCYKIVLKDESIVASRFMHDNFAISNFLEALLVVAIISQGSHYLRKRRLEHK
ncbi:protein CYPRO4-like [Quillaja saponaria]|uniref:Protein CYPRO4-like n=1 Tax=Quillaja saponaria TaxID=32244 RepID=A0AAD7P8W0_QUISA|nr:protein CYPRO4-like [Quillaja saponaria]